MYNMKSFGNVSIPLIDENKKIKGFLIVGQNFAKRLTKLQQKNGHLEHRNIVVHKSGNKYKAKIQ
jgi:hypothetical protein